MHFLTKKKGKKTECILQWTGQIVGVILLGDAASSQSDSLLDVTFTSRPSVRWLAESEASANATKAAEVALVRLTLAWVTGLILLISVLLGVRFVIWMSRTLFSSYAAEYFSLPKATSFLFFIFLRRSVQHSSL